MPARTAGLPPTLEEHIAGEAIPFSTEDADSLNAAADRLMAASDPSLAILALGEPTHLVDDYLRLRNRLFQALVERHGFRAIAIESGFPRGEIVNDFVAGRRDAIDEALEYGITHGMGRMPANRELLEWVRRYNDAGAPGRDKLHFYGFDSPTEMTHADSPRHLLTLALDYLGTLSPPSGQSRRRQIEPLFGADANWENPAAMMDPAKSVGRSPAANELRVATEDLIAELATLQPQGASTDAPAYRRAMRYALHARQMLAYHAVIAQSSSNRIVDALSLRDAMMADNLLYIARQEESRGKVFAFAHNSHLKRGQAVWQWGSDRWAWWPAGAHLSASMGNRYSVIGVGVGTSGASQLGPPEAGTLEALLLAAPGPARLLPTHAARSLGIHDPNVRTANPQFFPFDRQSLTDFDWLALLDRAD